MTTTQASETDEFGTCTRCNERPRVEGDWCTQCWDEQYGETAQARKNAKPDPVRKLANFLGGSLTSAALALALIATPAHAQTDCDETGAWDDGSKTVYCPATGETWALDPDGREDVGRAPGTWYAVEE